eukprot:TRINITY_DN17208_c2_g1_i1.p1 TRINITY_DN17208_c2_g1~~TRINITY_DN17208_c2_g1_i1.p1  ORF type:complete len:1294 (+),score=185.92 TRINITY_DN17208_c2_g1_i1:1174-5055(+)
MDASKPSIIFLLSPYFTIPDCQLAGEGRGSPHAVLGEFPQSPPVLSLKRKERRAAFEICRRRRRRGGNVLLFSFFRQVRAALPPPKEMKPSLGWFSGVEARDYLVQKKVMDAVEGGLSILLKENPKDPVGRFAEVLREKNPNRSTTEVTVDGIKLKSISPATVLKNTPLPTVPNWRRSGSMNVWAMSSTGFDGWKRIIDFIKTSQKSITKIVTIEVNKDTVTYYRGSPHVVVEGGKFTGATHSLSTLQHVLKEAARSRDSRHTEFEVLRIPMPDSLKTPDASKYTDIQDVIFNNKQGILESESTAVIVHSISGTSDATVGMIMVSAVVQAIQKIRTNGLKKAQWKEKLRDRVIKKREVAAIIAMRYQALLKKDQERASQIESSGGKMNGETEAETDERRAKAEMLTQGRNSQWGRYNALVREMASTTISSAYRGYSGRKLASMKKSDPKFLDAPKTSDHELYTIVKGVQSKDHQITAYPIVLHTISTLLKEFGDWELFTGRQQARSKLVVERDVVVANTDENDDPSQDLFRVVTVQDTDNEKTDDFCIPMTSFINVVRSCSHLRSYVSEMYSMGRRFGQVGAVQARILRAFEFFSTGVAFFTHSVLREVSTSPRLRQLFLYPESAQINMSFDAWFSQYHSITDAFQDHHLFFLCNEIRLKSRPVMCDRVLVQQLIGRQKGEQRKKSKISIDAGGPLMTDTLRKSQLSSFVVNESDSHRAFKRFHKKLNLYSVTDPVGREDLFEFAAQLGQPNANILWLSLSTDLSIVVEEEVYSAKLKTPTLCPSNQTPTVVKDCVITSPPLITQQPATDHNSKPRHEDPEHSTSPDDHPEVPIYNLTWSQLEGDLVQEIKSQTSNSRILEYIELQGGSGEAVSRKKSFTKVQPCSSEQQVKPVEEMPEKLPTPSGSRVMKIASGRRPPSMVGFSATPRRENSSIMTSITDPSTTPPPHTHDEPEDGALLGSPVVSAPVVDPGPVIQRLPSFYDQVLSTMDEGTVNLQYVRQPVLMCVIESMLSSLDRLSHSVNDFVCKNPTNGVIVVEYCDELNAMLTVAVCIMNSLASKKNGGDDPIMALVEAKKLQEAANNNAKRDHQVSAACSVNSEGTATTATDSGVGDTLGVTHQLLSSASMLKIAAEPSSAEPILSPFSPIDKLVKSPLGEELNLAASLTYVDDVISHSSRHIESSIVTKIAALYLECEQPLSAQTLRQHVTALVRYLELYGILIIFHAWMQHGSAVSFSSFVLEVHTGAYRWLVNLDPFEGVEQPKNHDPEWVSLRNRWIREPTLPTRITEHKNR